MSDMQTRLKELRAAGKISQKTLAEYVGLSLRGYQNYEYGEKEATIGYAIALADYFNVSLDYLVGRSDDPERR